VNYVELHIGDYEKATSHLTAVEDGIYGRLLRRYYDTEAPLPADMKAVQRLVRARSKEEREAVETVLPEFFQGCADGWRHKRCDEEIARYQEKRAKAKRSADARWSKEPPATDGNADDMRTHTERNANASAAHDERNALQSPDTREKQKPPIAPEGGNAGKGESGKGKSPLVTLPTYLADCQRNGVEPIPADDAVWTYADTVGLPHAYVELAWWTFQGRYLSGSKRYRDWRATFRNAVRGGWDHLWFLRDGGYALTTAGQQAEREMRSAA
jgi:uncharacterized protein YdaU (DUF1376 family)